MEATTNDGEAQLIEHLEDVLGCSQGDEIEIRVAVEIGKVKTAGRVGGREASS